VKRCLTSERTPAFHAVWGACRPPCWIFVIFVCDLGGWLLCMSRRVWRFGHVSTPRGDDDLGASQNLIEKTCQKSVDSTRSGTTAGAYYYNVPCIHGAMVVTTRTHGARRSNSQRPDAIHKKTCCANFWSRRALLCGLGKILSSLSAPRGKHRKFRASVLGRSLQLLNLKSSCVRAPKRIAFRLRTSKNTWTSSGIHFGGCRLV